ncbi:Fe-S cluster assembly protein SufD [Bdellovibrio sp. HCB288]|uniref:Fe-S cluster assembly protein SufD n=1 Tax=Bdellovibrio sp. HCB288 TaxID=3394355 RepID=UPI0039B561E0
MNLLSTYEKFSQAHPAKGAQASFRQAGYDYALKKGLPTRKDEEWHYTSVKVLADNSFLPSALNAVNPSHDTMVAIQKAMNPEFTNLVFFNGVFNKTLSSDLPAGLNIREQSEYSEQFDDTFDALNGAYAETPYFVHLNKDTSVDKPVNFVFFSSNEAGAAVMTSPRIRLEVGARSSLRVLESHCGVSGDSYFANSVFDLQVGDSANVIYVRVQADSLNAVNIGRTRISLGKHANLESLAFSTGAQLSRHNYDLVLKEKGSTSQVLGIYAVQGTQHVDNTTMIDHAVGECATHQLYKGILDGSGRSAFCGKILIRKDAQKADSSQLNNNLLLSNKAEADSKPSIEVHADDVKAGHGSTVGQLNKEELFYLLSRAIPKDKAIAMLSYGYLSEVLYKVSDERIQKWLTKHLDEAFARLHLN